jgi:hypothetical protein
MKVQGALRPQLQEQVRLRARESVPAARSSESEVTLISGAGRFLQDVREAAAQEQKVRAEVVAKARADILSGAIDSESELEAAVDALLAGV